MTTSAAPANSAHVSPRAQVVALLFALTFPTLLTWVYFLWLAQSSAGLQQAAYSIGKVIQFGFPVCWFVCVQRHRLSRPQFSRNGLLIGCLFGLAVVMAMFGAFHFWLKPSDAFNPAADAVREKVVGMGLNSVTKYAAIGIFYAAMHSLMEEYYWRWFVFGQLRRLTALVPAIAISSLGFMAHHVIVISFYFGWGTILSLFFSLGVAIGGVAWAWLYHRTRSLLGAWLSHAIVDAGIFLVGYEIVSAAW